MTILAPGFALGGWLPETVLPDHRAAVPAPWPAAPGSATRLMQEALVEAMAGVGLPSPNPNVGCVLVSAQGEVLAKGATAQHGGPHGERRALDRLQNPASARGATAYVMLEPCAHQGKQPPCTEALIKAGISRCVYAAKDPHELVSGRGLARLAAAGIAVEKGPLTAECVAWNLPFFFDVHYGRPLVVGKWAQTLNGQLADAGGGSQWISGPVARSYTHWLRQKYDAILVGAGTALADEPELSCRDTVGPLRQPLKILFDPSGRLAQVTPSARLLARTFATGTRLLLARPADGAAPSWLGRAGADVFDLPVTSRETAFEELLAALKGPTFERWYGRVVQSILVEGGAALLNHLLATDRLDACHVFVTPSFVSSDVHRIGHYRESPPPGMATVAAMRRHVLLQSAALGQDTLLEFMPRERWEKLLSEA